jgi:ferredoxin
MSSEPEAFRVTFLLPNGATRTIPVGRDEHIWDAAQAAGIRLPALCHQGYCLTCAARLVDGREVDQSDSLVYYPEDREAGFILPCTAIPRSDLKLRTHQAKEMREFRKQLKLLAPYSWTEE